MTSAGVRGVVARHSMHVLAIGALLVLTIAAVTLGLDARRRLEPARAGLARLRAAASEIASFRSSIDPASLNTLASDATSPHVAIDPGDRFSVARRVVALAEELGLSDVRIRVAPRDSVAEPTRPTLVRASVRVADYSLALEGSGSLANVLTLVHRLPASVALQRLAGARESGRTRYRLVLAVFESFDTPSAPITDTTPQLANLTALARAVPDSSVIMTGSRVVSLRRDPFEAPVVRPVARAQREPIAAPSWSLSAILMVGERRAAIINDVLMHAGDMLPGGTRLTAVEDDRVVLTDPAGASRTITLTNGEGRGERR